MTRRVVLMPDEVWGRLSSHAESLAVSRAWLARRLLERGLDGLEAPNGNRAALFSSDISFTGPAGPVTAAPGDVAAPLSFAGSAGVDLAVELPPRRGESVDEARARRAERSAAADANRASIQAAVAAARAEATPDKFVDGCKHNFSETTSFGEARCAKCKLRRSEVAS